MKIFNHITPKFSDLEWKMVKCIPPGGNWKDIPEDIPSRRLEQIRRSGGRTTYYGRLRNDRPAYTISTYFNRIGNGCHIHPEQDRLISIREGARLQSFPDSFVFYGIKSSQYKQVGNAVPPLLARKIAELLKPLILNKTYIDLFSGAGGMSEGFKMEGFKLMGSIELEKHYYETFIKNHSDEQNSDFLINGDITVDENKQKIIRASEKEKIGIVVGGPPCQGFSLAGWRNPEDHRNMLFQEFVDIVSEVKPEFFVLENVPGILTMSEGKFVKDIISEFRRIGYYVNEPILLKAEEFGVPQKRRRVFIIGSLNKTIIREPKPLFSDSIPYLPNPITVQEAIGGLPSLKSNDGCFEADYVYKPSSTYEKLMAGEISFKEFYESKRNDSAKASETSSTTLFSFFKE